jgi:hypothetical protein
MRLRAIIEEKRIFQKIAELEKEDSERQMAA